MKSLLVISALALVGCSAAQLQHAQAVAVTLRADLHTVLITGCANAPATEVALATILEFVPPGTTTDAIKTGVTIAEPQINALCAKVQGAPATPAPVTAS